MAGATYSYGPSSATLSTRPGEGFAGASGLESDDFADFVKQMIRRRIEAQRRRRTPAIILPPPTIPTAAQLGGGLGAAPVPQPIGREPVWLKDMGTEYIRLNRWEPGAVPGGYGM